MNLKNSSIIYRKNNNNKQPPQKKPKTTKTATKDRRCERKQKYGETTYNTAARVIFLKCRPSFLFFCS